MNNTKPETILFFSIYAPTLSPRDSVYVNGLRHLGIKVLECVDPSKGFKKFSGLIKKHKEYKEKYGVLMVGYQSAILVPLAKLISKKKIVFNALSSMYESTVVDREMYRRYSLKAIMVWLSDFFAFHLANITLVESESQKKHISKTYLVKLSKLYVLYTGVDESVFHLDPGIRKNDIFTVIFRGSMFPATGIEYVIEAINLLKEKDIQFTIIGWGDLLGKVKDMVSRYNLEKVTLIEQYMNKDELRKTILRGHVYLGQFSKHPRLDRTIQHKTSEALALGMPYITRDSISNRELLEDRGNCLFVKPADPKDIVDKILELKNDNVLRGSISYGARTMYEKKLTTMVLGRELKFILKNLV